MGTKKPEEQAVKKERQPRTNNPPKKLYSIVHEDMGEFTRDIALAAHRRKLETEGLNVIQVKDITNCYTIDVGVLKANLAAMGYTDDEIYIISECVMTGYLGASVEVLDPDKYPMDDASDE